MEHGKLLLLLCVAALFLDPSTAAFWAPPNWVGKLSDKQHSSIYCADTGADKLQLCQNREHMTHKLFAADVLGYCKYDWWTVGNRTDGHAPLDNGQDKDKKSDARATVIPGFDADFTNVAYAKNTYLYAVRKLRVQAASDVWLCSDEKCTIMQDVGFVQGDNSSDLMVFTTSSYIAGSMVALPLAGKARGIGTRCEGTNATTPDGFALQVKDYGVCFADKKHVIGPANNTFVPVVVPAYPAAVGVDSEFGPYGRLMVGTFETDSGCLRVAVPRHAWLIEHGWGMQHGCTVDEEDQSVYIFIAYFMPGWADVKSPEQSKLLKPSQESMAAWQESFDTYWWRYARAYYCDDDAMSPAYSGARCSVQDFSAEVLNVATNVTRDVDNWLFSLIIEGIPLLVYPTYPNKTIAGPGWLGKGETDYGNQGAGSNTVNASQVARWLFSADMLARDHETAVPWCADGESTPVIAALGSNITEDDPFLTGGVVQFINNPSTLSNDAANCELLESKGWLTLRKGTKPMDPFHTVLSSGLIAWRQYSGQTVVAQNMGFAGSNQLPPQAVTRAMLEAIQMVQAEAQVLAERLISTADMTATGMGAALNLYAFSMLALAVAATAADMVHALVTEIFQKRKHWIWAVYGLPPVLFSATLLPAPLLALLQEMNARKNNPNGEDVQIGFTQTIARGYGNYHLLVATVYKSKSLYQPATLICAWVAMIMACLGVLGATCYAWRKTGRIWREVLAMEKSRKDGDGGQNPKESELVAQSMLLKDVEGGLRDL